MTASVSRSRSSSYDRRGSMCVSILALVLMVSSAHGETPVDEFFEIPAEGRITLALWNADVTLVAHSESNLRVQGILGPAIEGLFIDDTDSGWRIETRPLQGFEESSSKDDSRLTLFLPNRGEFEVDLINGFLHGSGLSLTLLAVSTVNAGVTIERSTADHLQISSVNGEVQVQEVDVEAGRYETVNGNLMIHGAHSTLATETLNGETGIAVGNIQDLSARSTFAPLKADVSARPGATLQLTNGRGAIELVLDAGREPSILVETRTGVISGDFGAATSIDKESGSVLMTEGDPDAVRIHVESDSGPVVLRRAN